MGLYAIRLLLSCATPFHRHGLGLLFSFYTPVFHFLLCALSVLFRYAFFVKFSKWLAAPVQDFSYIFIWLYFCSLLYRKCVWSRSRQSYFWLCLQYSFRHQKSWSVVVYFYLISFSMVSFTGDCLAFRWIYIYVHYRM